MIFDTGIQIDRIDTVGEILEEIMMSSRELKEINTIESIDIVFFTSI